MSMPPGGLNKVQQPWARLLMTSLITHLIATFKFMAPAMNFQAVISAHKKDNFTFWALNVYAGKISPMQGKLYTYQSYIYIPYIMKFSWMWIFSEFLFRGLLALLAYFSDSILTR